MGTVDHIDPHNKTTQTRICVMVAEATQFRTLVLIQCIFFFGKMLAGDDLAKASVENWENRLECHGEGRLAGLLLRINKSRLWHEWLGGESRALIDYQGGDFPKQKQIVTDTLLQEEEWYWRPVSQDSKHAWTLQIWPSWSNDRPWEVPWMIGWEAKFVVGVSRSLLFVVVGGVVVVVVVVVVVCGVVVSRGVVVVVCVGGGGGVVVVFAVVGVVVVFVVVVVVVVVSVVVVVARVVVCCGRRCCYRG